MKVVDLAEAIHSEIGYDTATSIPAIAYWIRNQVGKINNLLFEDFYIEETSGNYEILHADGSEISIEAASVIQSFYKVYDYGVQVRSTMNALAGDSILQFTDNLQGSTVTKVNRNEVSKTFASLKAAEQENLNDLIGAYRMNHSEPSQIAGDDTAEGRYNLQDPYTLRDWNVN